MVIIAVAVAITIAIAVGISCCTNCTSVKEHFPNKKAYPIINLGKWNSITNKWISIRYKPTTTALGSSTRCNRLINPL